MSITLNPEVATRLQQAAQKEGMSPEIYLNDLLQNVLPPLSSSESQDNGAKPKTLAEVFAGRTGGIQGGGVAWSEGVGEAFSEGVCLKYGAADKDSRE
jgi:hypothetical protein